MKRLNLLIAAALALAFLSACAGGPTYILSTPAPVLDRIQKQDEIKVGTAAGMPPFNMTTKDGRIIGMEVDMARYLADSLGVKLNLQKMAFKDLLPALEAGKLDMVISGLTMTAKRNSRVAFVGPYFVSGKALLTKTATLASIEDPDDIDETKVTLTALEGSTSQQFVKAVFPKAKFLPAKDYDAGVDMVIRGRADAMIADHPFCLVSVARYPDQDLFTIVTPFTYEPIGIALPSRDPLLVNLVQNFLNTLESSGAMDNLKKKWFQKGDWWDQLQ